MLFQGKGGYKHMEADPIEQGLKHSRIPKGEIVSSFPGRAF
jgi:hypothetical protein